MTGHDDKPTPPAKTPPAAKTTGSPGRATRGALKDALIEHAGSSQHQPIVELALAAAKSNHGTLFVTTHNCEALGSVPPTHKVSKKERAVCPPGTPAFILIDLAGLTLETTAQMILEGRFKAQK